MPIVTMADVAREANVSATTVARAIYNNGYVSESKRQHILAVAKELGYVPNKLARGLKNQSSYVIGNIVPISTVNLFFNHLTEALSVEAGKRDYHITSVFSDGDEVQERKILEDLVGRAVDAIIFTAGTFVRRDNVEWLLKLGIPVVMIERAESVPGVDKVLIDNFLGSYSAVRHIAERGHTKIGFIGCQPIGITEQQRLDGYRQAMAEAGLECRPEWEVLLENYNSPMPAFEGAKKILSGPERPTAIFASSDIYACGVLKYAQQQGLSVPEDLSLVGFDNTLSEFLAPAVTSVGIPVQQIGEAAVRLAMERIGQKRSVGESVCFSPFLVDRGTVREMK